MRKNLQAYEGLEQIVSTMAPKVSPRAGRASLLGKSARLLLLLLTCGLAACATTAMDPERGLGSKIRKADEAQAGVSPRVGVEVVGIAARMKGVPYVFGGSTPAGFDCSGLVHYSYARAGVQVPRTVQAQFAAATRISHEVAEPGDLLFFFHADKWHVAIYMGGDNFIHAPWPGSTVSVATVRDNFYRSKLVGVGRLIPQ